MFPDAAFLGMSLYYWMFLIGVIAAMVVGRLFSGRVGLGVKVYNLSVVVSVAAIILGYVSSVLFQSWYHYLETGEFRWGVGSTFYGGLIGAVVVYLALYFLLGHYYCKEGEHIAQFNTMLSLITPCIIVAHAFGRIGCLFNGCCYGAVTEGFGGIDMYVHGEWQHRVPLQLYEAVFLFVLFAVLLFLLLKFRFEYTASAYLVCYGIWRFIIEFFRDDDRGSSGIASLSPSQLTAIFLVLFGVGFALFYRWFLKARLARRTAHEKA